MDAPQRAAQRMAVLPAGTALGSTLLLICLLTIGCSRSNNLLLGRVEAKVGSHLVVVTDCYRTKPPQPQRIASTPGDPETFRYTPCRDADVLIRGEELFVNGISYGTLEPGDSVVVDHGKVLINDSEAARD